MADVGSHVPRRPPYKRMILDAITMLARPNGCSRTAIRSSILDLLGNEPARFDTSLRRALDRLVNNGSLTRTANSFRIVPKHQRPTAIKRLTARISNRAGFQGLRRPGWRVVINVLRGHPLPPAWQGVIDELDLPPLRAWHGVISVPRMGPYERTISEAITMLDEPDGSSSTAIINHMEEQNHQPMSNNDRRRLRQQLHNLVKKGMATRIRNKFKLRPENQRPHVLAQFREGRDKGYEAGRAQAANED